MKRINPGFTPCDNGHYTNLPKGWAICKLSDLCRIENGFAFSSNDYKSQGIPLVRISNITHNTIDITDCVYVEGITDNKFKISKGDLLIAMSGATTRKKWEYICLDEIAYPKSTCRKYQNLKQVLIVSRLSKYLYAIES